MTPRTIGLVLAAFALLATLAACSSVAVKTIRFAEGPGYPPTLPDLVQVIRAEPGRTFRRWRSRPTSSSA